MAKEEARQLVIANSADIVIYHLTEAETTDCGQFTPGHLAEAQAMLERALTQVNGWIEEGARIMKAFHFAQDIGIIRQNLLQAVNDINNEHVETGLHILIQTIETLKQMDKPLTSVDQLLNKLHDDKGNENARRS